MSGNDAAQATVEVVCAEPERQTLRTLQVPVGTCVQEVIAQSGILQAHPDVAVQPLRVGIFGRRVDLQAVVSDGDRIEIYRPLVADPKDSRRARVQAARARRAGRT